MSLVRTIIAYCDATEVFAGGGEKDCFESVSLDPGTAQPFQRLTEIGWTTINVGDEIKTVCPKHTGARSV